MTASRPIQAEDIQGWMEPDELAWLRETAARMNSIVEIGCWKGRSTHALLSWCPGWVYAVDHFQGSPEERDAGHKEALEPGAIKAQFVANVGHFPNLSLIVAYSADAARRFALAEVDMVFIDGSHAFIDVARDIAYWLPIASRMIAGHDFGAWPGVTQAVTEAFMGRVHRGPGSIWYVELSN